MSIPVNLKVLKRLMLAAVLSVCFAGCGGDHGHDAGKLVFKGTVVKVEYELTQRTTKIHDAEGKVIELNGHPGIPLSEIEIYQHGEHEYQIFPAPKQKS
jgi:hypothetical protein